MNSKNIHTSQPILSFLLGLSLILTSVVYFFENDCCYGEELHIESMENHMHHCVSGLHSSRCTCEKFPLKTDDENHYTIPDLNRFRIFRLQYIFNKPYQLIKVEKTYCLQSVLNRLYESLSSIPPHVPSTVLLV